MAVWGMEGWEGGVGSGGAGGRVKVRYYPSLLGDFVWLAKFSNWHPEATAEEETQYPLGYVFLSLAATAITGIRQDVFRFSKWVLKAVTAPL